MTRRRLAAVSGTARAILRPAVRPLEARGTQTPLSRRRAIVYVLRTARRLASLAGRPSLPDRQTMPRSFENDAAIASSRSFAHGRQEPVARPYPARLRPSPSDERWAPGAGRLSRRSLATSAAGEDLCRRLCSSFCAPGATAHHLPVTMWQVSLCRVRLTVRVVATHRCAPLPATRDRPGRLHGRCAADRDGGALAAAAAAAAAAWGQTVRASQPRRHSTPLASVPRGRFVYGGGEGEGAVPCNKKI